MAKIVHIAKHMEYRGDNLSISFILTVDFDRNFRIAGIITDQYLYYRWQG